jgi:hypothetical protein
MQTGLLTVKVTKQGSVRAFVNYGWRGYSTTVKNDDLQPLVQWMKARDMWISGDWVYSGNTATVEISIAR